MGINEYVGQPGPPTDPASDGRANYDYVAGEVDRPGLVADLRSRVSGDVRFDEYTRQLYATDASAYEVTPIGVVFPEDAEDVASVMTYCAEREIPVLPRGGGTSLAGQTVNEAVVLDFSRHMTDLLEVDPDGRTATLECGMYIGDLNAELEPHGLKFAPDPAWRDKSAIGGAIGNNSSGSHSLKYGMTAAYVERAGVVLADGTVTEFGEMSLDELAARADPDGDLEARICATVERFVEDEGDEILDVFPTLKRNVSGYDLDRLIERAREEGTVNLAKLLCGSEGTLATVTKATVGLEPLPNTKSVALLFYEDLVSAMEDVSIILEHDPAAVEVLDDVLLGLASETEEFGDLVGEILPEGTGATLLVEFYAEDDADGKQKVANLFADRTDGVESMVEPEAGAEDITSEDVIAFDAREAHDDDQRNRFWKLRKSGLPILLGRTTDEKHISFIEDMAVPPENLPDFVSDFQAVLENNDTIASIYAHAGPGCLHIRPLVNTKTLDGVNQMRSIAEDATDLVVEYGGSVSGEHGDGRARSGWNRKLYGQHVWELLRELKHTFDPGWLLNPSQVCGYAPEEDLPDGVPERARVADMTENLRFDPEYDLDIPFEPTLNWDNDNGMQGMVELCHGCGGCRGPQGTTGGVMCPTYRAANEEIQATRGRANMLRQAMSGDLPDDPRDEQFMDEVLDMCVGCKGCAKDCPSEVDMAKLKVEVKHAHHEEHGAGLRDRLFANAGSLYPLASALAPLSNWAQKLPGAGIVQEKLLGIARERELPTFYRNTFVDRFADYERTVSEAEADRKVLLFPDTFTNYNRPEAGMAAVEVLEAAGVYVEVPTDVTDSGRAPHSKGFLDKAREHAEENVAELAPRIEEGWDLVVVEPSEAVMFQTDYLDLLSGEAVERVAANAYGVSEYLDVHRLDEDIVFDAPAESLSYHGHCHQKATKKDHHAVGVLRRAGYEVDAIDSTCCGMAGSFGYEAEHYSMSKAIASIVYDQLDRSSGESVVAPGASCRGQLKDYEGAEPPHPIERLADALA
ncbi:MAG: FAD-binding and (Fe-S)-binding domain-containing protein [Halapricum sp.]